MTLEPYLTLSDAARRYGVSRSKWSTPTSPRPATWAELAKTVGVQRSHRRKTKRVPDGQLSLLDLVG
jgi:hypothetical protein